MKWLRGFIVVVLVGFTWGTVAGAQSLADVAKKEKTRRQENSTSTKTITEWELAQSYGGLRETTSSSGDADDTEGTEEDETTAEQDETKTREYWEASHRRQRADHDHRAAFEQQ